MLTQTHTSKARFKEATIILPAQDGKTAFLFSPEIFEQLRYMLTRTQADDELPHRISIVSTLHGEGVTYVANALGAVLAHDMGFNVCIVDLNWHFPATVYPFQPDQPGLADVLDGKAILRDVLVCSGWQNLSWLPAGQMNSTQNPQMIRGSALKAAIDDLATQFDYLLFDVPAILTTSDSIPLASLAKACYVVVQQGVTTEREITTALDQIPGIRKLGIILNQVNYHSPKVLLRALIGN